MLHSVIDFSTIEAVQHYIQNHTDKAWNMFDAKLSSLNFLSEVDRNIARIILIAAINEREGSDDLIKKICSRLNEKVSEIKDAELLEFFPHLIDPVDTQQARLEKKRAAILKNVLSSPLINQIKTPLSYAILHNDAQIIINVLFAYGLDPSLSSSGTLSPLLEAVEKNKLNVAKLILAHGIKMDKALCESIITVCEEKIATFKAGSDKKSLLEWEQFLALVKTLRSKYFEKDRFEKLKQGNLIQKIQHYVKEHNQRAQATMSLPVDDEGWCAGLTSVWGYLKAHGDKKHNENWFFEKLRTITDTPFETIPDQLDVQKIIAYVNLLQGKDRQRAEWGFDAQQGYLDKALGLTMVDIGQLVCDGNEDIKLLLETFVMTHPDKFVRLCNLDHATGLVYEDVNKEFSLYDPNVNNKQRMIVVNFVSHEEPFVEEQPIPEIRLSLDELMDNLPEIFEEKTDPHLRTLEAFVYDEFQKRNEKDVQDRLNKLSKQSQSRKQKFYSTIYESRVERSKDLNASKNGYATLALAASQGDLDAVKVLLENGVDVNGRSAGGFVTNTPLMCAASTGWLDIARLLIDSNAEVDAKNNVGLTALMCASSAGHRDIVQLLIEENADINGGDRVGNTALMSASSSGQLDIVQLLIEKGADINGVDRSGNTALMSASRSGQLEIVQLLVAKRANIGAKTDAGETALSFASSAGHVAIARLLIDKGAEINASDSAGFTALIIASTRGQWPVVQLLIKRGADIHKRTSAGHTALMWAARSGHHDVVQLLIDFGADVDADCGGDTAAHLAANSGKSNIVQLLLANGANIDAKDCKGRTLLIIAIARSDNKLAQMLIQRGSNINIQDKEGQTPLMCALKSRERGIAQDLINNGAQIDVADNNGQTALQIALKNNDFAIAKILIAKGAKINFKENPGGITPLMVAALCGKTEQVMALINQGADVNAKNDKNDTALILAMKNDQKEICLKLIELGADIHIVGQHGQTAFVHAIQCGWNDVALKLFAKGAKIDVKDTMGRTALDYAKRLNNQELVQAFESTVQGTPNEKPAP